MKRLAFIPILICSLAPSMGLIARPRQEGEKTPPATVSKAPQPAGVVTISYDQAKDKSNVGFVDLTLLDDAAISIALNLGCSYKGRTPGDPGQCFVSLTARSHIQQFHEHSTPFRAEADGKVVIDKPFQSFGSQRESEDFIEPIISLWRLSEIRALAKAKSVVFVVGERKIALTDPEVKVIREVSDHFAGCCALEPDGREDPALRLTAIR